MNDAKTKWLLRVAQWYAEKGFNPYEQAELLYQALGKQKGGF